jgi:hypothetical protein
MDAEERKSYNQVEDDSIIQLDSQSTLQFLSKRNPHQFQFGQGSIPLNQKPLQSTYQQDENSRDSLDSHLDHLALGMDSVVETKEKQAKESDGGRYNLVSSLQSRDDMERLQELLQSHQHSLNTEDMQEALGMLGGPDTQESERLGKKGGTYSYGNQGGPAESSVDNRGNKQKSLYS